MSKLMLGEFLFSVDTAAFQTLQRSTARRWAKIERIGKRAAMQDLGPGDDTLTMPGVIYPHYKGGLEHINKMREMMAKGEPLMLVDVLGNVHSNWVIMSVTEKDSTFIKEGAPLKQEFTLKIQRYEE